MDMGLKGKRALISASSRGLGYGIAGALAAEGAQVSMGSRDEQKLAESAREIREKTGSTVHSFALNSSDSESIQSWVESSLNAMGGADILVINAGGPPIGTFLDLKEEDWQLGFNLTLMSAVRMIQAIVPALKEAGGGSILAITSLSAKEPIDNLVLSNVFRSGVIAMLKGLSRELAPFNIRVNNIMPGRIDTDRVRNLDRTLALEKDITVDQQKTLSENTIPLGRYGTIEEFGQAAAFLCSTGAAYVTGATFVMDGGLLNTTW